MPLPTKEVCDASKEKWALLTHNSFEPKELPYGLQESFRSGLSWVDDNIPLQEDDSFPAIGTSSCLQYTSKEGGRTRFLRELVADDLETRNFETIINYIKSEQDKLMEGKTSLPFPIKTELGRTLKDELIPQYIEEKLAAPRPITMMKSVIVREYGFKARIVTKADAINVTLAHKVRKRLFRALKTVRAMHAPLSENYEIPGLKKTPHRFVFSSDLSNATDTISHQVLDMVCLGLGIPACFVHHVEDELGRWKRGCPMGMPPSWAILSVIHYVICHHVDPSDHFRIKGDDLLSYWTMRMVSRYAKLVHSVGLILNQEKSFTSRDRGVFCEKMFLLELDSVSFDTETYVLRPVDRGLFPLRVVLDKSQNYRVEAASLVRSKEFHNRIDSLPYGVLQRLQKVAFYDEIRLAKQYGIDPYAPTYLGGFGLLPPKMYGKPSHAYQCAYANMHNHPNEYKLSLVLSGYDPFRSAYGVAANSISNRLRVFTFVVEGASPYVTADIKPLLANIANDAMLTGGILSNKSLEPPKAKTVFENLRVLRMLLQAEYRPMGCTYKAMYDLESRICVRKCDLELATCSSNFFLNLPDPLDPDLCRIKNEELMISIQPPGL
jgi:hypothetical protein